VGHAHPAALVTSAASNSDPQLAGRRSPVNRGTWGGPDYRRNYFRWWFAHLPRARGTGSDARANNWWKYVFDFDRYDERGAPKR
jgi:hypothetical protein